MIKPIVRTLIIIFVFFLLDLIKPFGYFLTVEFLLLGLVIIAGNESLPIALMAGFLSAWFRDFFIFGGSVTTLFEFPLFCLFIHYLMRSRRIFLAKPKQVLMAKGIIAALIFCLHILVNSIQSRLFIPFLSFQFLVQSICVYYLVDYLFGQKEIPICH